MNRGVAQQVTRATRRILVAFALCAAVLAPGSSGSAQYEDESSFTLDAMVRTQVGVFVPLASEVAHSLRGNPKNRNSALYIADVNQRNPPPCSPIAIPRAPCRPQNHAKDPGSLSLSRLTLQLEGHLDVNSQLAVHGILRAVRSLPLAADEYGQPAVLLLREDGEDDISLEARRRAFARDFAYYTEQGYTQFNDLRELYVDYWPNDWLSFRLGRQQVAWGETGQFRMLDVVNPADNTWHFGPLESFEDQRIPLWMLNTTFDLEAINSSLEVLWIPGIDKARFSVNPPLTQVGAWGLPYSNQPPNFQIRFRDFQFPGGGFFKPEHMRGGARLKGTLGTNAGYSLVYFYTHMMRPTLDKVDLVPRADGVTFDDTDAQRAVLTYPRQHIAGGSFEYTWDSPVATTFRFEGSIQPDRTFAPNPNKAGDNSDPSQITFESRTKPTLNYALVVQRPTMIRWLNPTNNFLLVSQFMHTHVFDVDPVEDEDLVHLIGFNDWRIQRNSYTFVAFARTQYGHGLFTPKLVGVWMFNPDVRDGGGLTKMLDSGFVTLDLGFRIGPHYRLNIQATDFIGRNAYRDIGLFRDRDEVAVSFTVLL